MLEDIKTEVLRIALLAEETGLCRHGGGNFSQMDREKGLIVITPHAVSRHTFTADDLLVIDIEGNVIENKRGFEPTSETPMHTLIYKERPDASAVCHTHAKNSTAFSCMGGMPVKPVAFEAIFYVGTCRVAPFVTPGSAELGESAVEYMKGSHAVILGKHGLVTIGSNIYDAYLKTCYVEDICDINIRAASVVGYENLDALSEEEVAKFRPLFGF